MNYIDTFSSHQNVTQERKQAWYTTVSVVGSQIFSFENYGLLSLSSA